MRFELSDDQQEIKRAARAFLERRAPLSGLAPVAAAGSYDPTLWADMAELGWPALAVRADQGGMGFGVVELAAVVEELGYACAAAPILGNILAAIAIDRAGTEGQRESWLGDLASGTARGALGVESGTVGGVDLVPDGPGADVLVTVDPTWRKATLLGAPQVELASVRTVDQTRGYGRVTGSGGGDVLSGDVSGVMDRALIVVSAELVGLCQRALDMTVAYAKERRQFGNAIGSFQAVGHTAAQMLRDTECARSAVYYAAWVADAGEPGELAVAAAMAKATASEAGRAVTAAAIQLHGAFGFTWEADVHWLYTRALVDSSLFRGPDVHRRRITDLVSRRKRESVMGKRESVMA